MKNKVLIFISGLFMTFSITACLDKSDEVRYSKAPENGIFRYEGLPQRPYELAAEYDNGRVIPLYYAGTQGYIIKPTGPIDTERRWVWIAPLYLAVNSTYGAGDMAYQYYVEALLQAGYHIIGTDVGVSCGSPAGVEVYQNFYNMLVSVFKLNKKAILIGQSNGGLICYSWAFRYPNQVNRILGIFPATDLLSWPGLDGVFMATPKGLAYDLSGEQFESRLTEFNPIDNLEPLAKAGVKIFHVHGDADNVVPIEPNSYELAKRYKALGGNVEIQTVKGGVHDTSPDFYNCKRGLEFLLEDLYACD